MNRVAGARRRVELVPMETVPIRFSGLRAAEGPLSFGQRAVAQWLCRKPDDVYATLCVEFEVPAGVSIDRVVQTIAVLVARHEGLRTEYCFDEPMRQRVVGAGEIELEVCAVVGGRWDLADGGDVGDRRVVVDALTEWLRGRKPVGALPPQLRVAVAVTGHERVVGCVAGFSHLGVDLAALLVLRRQFAELVGDPAAPLAAGGPRHQPLDQAAYETTPAAGRLASAALRHVTEQLERSPQCLFIVPGGRAGGGSVAIRLSSVAAALAVGRVAARTRVIRSSVVLAAVAAVVAYRAGYEELVLPMMSHNRFEQRLAGYVGNLAQPCLATIAVGSASFDVVVRRAWAAMLTASRHGRYDAYRRAEAEKRIEHERGLRFMHDPLFNNLVTQSGRPAGPGPTAQQVRAALPHTELAWRSVPPNGTPLRFLLEQADDELLRLDVWSADTALVTPTELQSLCRAVEGVLVAAAAGDLDQTAIHAATGLDPFPRGPGWLRIDHCWVELAEVQRLLDHALPGATARIFPTAHGTRLVARLAATASASTPGEAHRRCMAALTHYPTALTPHHYRIYPTAPPPPDDPTSWPEPLTTGTGRQLSR